MELNTFMRELEASLVKRGFPEDIAREQVEKITKKFTPQDLEEIGNIRSSADIEALADGIASILNQKRAAQGGQAARKPAQAAERRPAPQTAPDTARPAQPSANRIPAQVQPEQQRPRPVQTQKAQPAQPEAARPRRTQVPDEDAAYPESGFQRPYPAPARPAQPEQQSAREQQPAEARQNPRPVQRPARQEPQRTGSKRSREPDENDYFVYSAESTPSTKGLLVFWVGLFLTLPITIAILAAIYGLFAVLFVALAALLVAGIAVLIAVVAAGAVIALISIVFGITQLFTFVAGGIYEIGLGVMVAGAALFVSILIYNFSLRFIPWVMRKLGTFVSFVSRKLKELFLVIRRGCYKL